MNLGGKIVDPELYGKKKLSCKKIGLRLQQLQNKIKIHVNNIKAELGGRTNLIKLITKPIVSDL